MCDSCWTLSIRSLKFWACPGISCSRKFIFVRSKVLGSFFGWFLPSLVLAFFPSSAFVCVQSYTFHWWWLGLYLPCFCFHMSRPGLIYVVIILWGILAPRTLQPLPCTRQLWELRSGIWTYCWRHLPFAPGGATRKQPEILQLVVMEAVASCVAYGAVLGAASLLGISWDRC